MYLTDTIFYVFSNMYRTDTTQPTLFLYFVFFHQIFTPKECIQDFLKQAKIKNKLNFYRVRLV